MNYKEASVIAMNLIDEDINSQYYLDKLPYFFDMAQKEISKIIPIKKVVNVKNGDPLPEDYVQVLRVINKDMKSVPYEIFDKKITLDEGEYMLEYAAEPTTIKSGVSDGYIFEVDRPEAIPYYGAACCIMSENQQLYLNLITQYYNILNNLKNRDQFKVVID